MSTVWVNPFSPIRYSGRAGTFRDRQGQTNEGPALLLQTDEGDEVVVEAGTVDVLLAYLEGLRNRVVDA